MAVVVQLVCLDCFFFKSCYELSKSKILLGVITFFLGEDINHGVDSLLGCLIFFLLFYLLIYLFIYNSEAKGLVLGHRLDIVLILDVL